MRNPNYLIVRRILLLILGLHYYFIAVAGTQVYIKPEPGWIYPVVLDATRNPDPKNISRGYYFDLMDRQVNLVSQTVYQHYIRHIINESGVQDASEVSVSFSPQYQQVIFHKVFIIRDGKSISQLKISTIKTADEEPDAANYLYNGIRRAYIILKDVQKGDLIEVSYSIIGFNPVFKGLYSSDIYFFSSTPISNYHLSFLTKPDKKLNLKFYNNASAPEEQLTGGYKSYQWTNPFIETNSTGSSIPSWYTNSPFISVSEFSNWKQVADWGLSIFNNYQYTLPEKLLQKMAVWRKESAGDQDMFANLALRFVQDQIRYLGLEIGTNTHQPHSPETVFDHRFGDCKDKALLLTMILNHENIKAYVALANTLERENLSQAAPSPIAFNHAIVAIKRSNEYIFVDPTFSLQRGELINSYIPAYSWALIVKPDENQLTAVEPGFLYAVSVTEDMEVSFEDTSLLSVTSIYKGGAADDIRNTLSKSSMQDLNEGYLKYYGKLYDGVKSDSGLTSADDSVRNEVKIVEAYKIPGLWHKKDNGKMEFNIYERLISQKLPDPDEHKSSEPVSLDFPYSQEYILRITMPEEWPLNMSELHVKNSSYQYDFTPEAKGNHLYIKYYFKTFRDHIPAEEFNQYKTDYKEIEKCFSLSFSRNDFLSPAARDKNFKPEQNINWLTVWLSFFFCVLITMLFNFLNKKSKPADERMDAALPLNGVIVLLGITLAIRFLVQGYGFLNENYYKQTLWLQLGITGGSSLHSLFIAEMLLSILSMAGSLVLLYWFFKRRDIFPSMFTYYALFFLCAQFIILVVYYNLHVDVDMTAAKKTVMTQFTRMAIYSAIWISFVIRSEKVKQTFVYPYR